MNMNELGCEQSPVFLPCLVAPKPPFFVYVSVLKQTAGYLYTYSCCCFVIRAIIFLSV